jgi:hypothetical protein
MTFLFKPEAGTLPASARLPSRPPAPAVTCSNGCDCAPFRSSLTSVPRSWRPASAAWSRLLPQIPAHQRLCFLSRCSRSNGASNANGASLTYVLRRRGPPLARVALSPTNVRSCRIQRAKSRHDVAASRVDACVSTHLAQRPTAASGLPVAPGPEVNLGLRRTSASR